MTRVAKRRISEIAPMAALTAATLVGSAAHAQDSPLISYVFGTIPFKNEASLPRAETRLAIHDTAVVRLKPATGSESKDNLSDINASPCTGARAIEPGEAKLLVEKAEVAVAPGLGFGEHGDEYVRLAIVENEQRIRQAARNLKKFFDGADATLHNVIDIKRAV